MTSIKTLPLIQDAKFIVIDEGVEVVRATDLIAGWLQMWQASSSDQSVDVLLFSDPKVTFDHWVEKFGSKNLKIHDYYTQNIDDIKCSKKRAIDLDGIMNNLISGSRDVRRATTVVVNCLSNLVLLTGFARAIRFIEKLSSRVDQLICIYRRDFILNRVPCIETLGSTYVRLDKSDLPNFENDISYEITVKHRKQSGGIVKSHVVISQDIYTYEIKSERNPVIKTTGESVVKLAPKLTPQATFRLDMNSRELNQRNTTPLPYTINSNNACTQQSKILYVPDDLDDLDEEDPDDDLPF